MTTTTNNLPEVGTVWYVWGDHREVSEHTTVDGEPAVRFRNHRTGKVARVPVIWRLAERVAIPSGAES